MGFNIKFDLHWLRRYGVILPRKALVWDCQLAEFIISNQETPLPSLEDTIEKYKLGEKYVDINVDYWDKGIDTDKIPTEIVLTRVESDVVLTSKLFEWQMDYLKGNPQLRNLIWASCQDQIVLAEMEWNGLRYAIELSKELGDGIIQEQGEIKKKLLRIVPIPQVNWNSGDQLSIILYGGTLSFDVQEEYVFTYKSGLTKTKTRWVKQTIPMPRRVEPIQGSDLKKEGFWSTDDTNLSKLKPKDKDTKTIIDLVLLLRKMAKKVGTYFHGLPKLYKDMQWTNNILHGNLQSAVTATGRLSSTKPNQQNMDHEIRKCIVSRFQ